MSYPEKIIKHKEPYKKIALIGGIYSNYLALEKSLELAREHQVEQIFILGDLGAFGPYPNRTIEIIRSENLPCIQGNYEQSLSSDAEDCFCGYTDPRDNHYAQISYDYTRKNTAVEHKKWMGELPHQRRIKMAEADVLLCHGSPRQVNEFIWESGSSDAFIKKLLNDFNCDIIANTHTGIPWQLWFDKNKGLVNCGAIGRPANNGKPEVSFTLLEDVDGKINAQNIAVNYDHKKLAQEVLQEALPEVFAQTLNDGYWTTCLEILPAKERALGRF